MHRPRDLRHPRPLASLGLALCTMSVASLLACGGAGTRAGAADAPEDGRERVGSGAEDRELDPHHPARAEASVGSDTTEAAAREPRPPETIFHDELVRATKGGSPPYLMRQLGPEAYRPQGRFVGWRITRVWPDDPGLCEPGCDLHPGDVIVSVNGRRIEYPEQLSDLMAELPQMTRLSVEMLREGKLRRASYDIVAAEGGHR